MARLAFACVVAAVAFAWPAGRVTPLQSRGLYDPDPNHIWNRVHRQLHVRTASGIEYGEDEVDPLLWHETKYLLTEPSHSRTIELLDEFLAANAERLIADPLKRAVFQHDLWAVFDWAVNTWSHTYPEPRRALAQRLARVMRRVALTKNQIERLPDTYADTVRSRAFAEHYDRNHRERSFLPPDMFASTGPWVGTSGSIEPVAPEHAFALSHSAFSVLFRLPGGSAATLAFLKSLWDFPHPYAAEAVQGRSEQRSALNPAPPQLPPGSHLALVRRMLLIDDQGTILRSQLTENIQLRVFHSFPDQDFFEFQVRRRKLFAGESGGLHAVTRGEHGFITFSSHGMDLFEMHPPRVGGRAILDGCTSCHFNIAIAGDQPPAGYHSIRSVRRLLKPYAFDPVRANWQFDDAAWKARRYDWGLLQAYWHSSPPTPR